MEYPIKEFTLEVTSVCNFHCIFCPYDDMVRPRGQMDFDLACRLIDEVAEKKLARIAGMEIIGEPTLYPRLFELMDHARSRNLPMYMTTNGSMFSDKTIPRLLDGALETLLVSYQTPDEKTFAQRGAGMSFLEYRERIENLVRYRLHNESPTEVGILLMCTMHNLLKSPRVIDRFGDAVKEIDRWVSFVEAEGVSVDREKIRDGLRDYKKRAFASTIDTRLVLTPAVSVHLNLSHRWGPWIMEKHGVRVTPSREGVCSVPLEQFHVLWDGRVTYCCYDVNGEMAVGDLNTMSVEEVLNGPIAGVRAAVRRRELPSEFCRRCRGYVNTLDLVKALDPVMPLRLASDPGMLAMFFQRIKNAELFRKLNPFSRTKL